MKRSLIFIFLCFLPSLAFGQGSFIPPQQALKTVNGITSPVANATITVCPANSSGIPCTPASINLFKDAALTQPLSNPMTADSLGNYVFAVTPGNYTVTVTATGFAGYSSQVTASLSPSANNSFSGTNQYSGSTTFNGSLTINGTTNAVVTNPTAPQTVSGPALTFNCKSITTNVKCVDPANTQSWTGSDIGAWINSASATIGPNGANAIQGEIWVFSPSQTNATTQISLNDQQSLKIFGTIGVNAPILIGKFGQLSCTAASSAASGANIIATQAMANLIRMRVQDGSLETMYVNGCILNFGGFSVTRGVLDVTGVNDRGSFGITNPLIITNFTGTGAGIYLDDCPGGTCTANAGSGHMNFGSIWINPANGVSSTAPCVEILHSNTAGGTPLGPEHFTSLECQLLLDTTTTAILIQNSCTATCGTSQWQFQSGIYIDELEIDNSCAACDGLKFDGVMGADIGRLYSFGGNATSNLIHVTNNANNVGIHIAKIFNISAGKAYLDDITTLSSTAKQIRNFTAGAQTTGSSAYNAFDETTFWGNLVGVSAMPAGLGGANRFACYGLTTINGISCTLNGNNDVAGFSQNSPFYIGTFGSGKYYVDTAGGAGTDYRFINNGNNFAGITIAGLKFNGGTLPATTTSIARTSVAGSTTLLAANSCGDTVTVTVTGATTSMDAHASGTISAGLIERAWVSAANTVSVMYCNITTAGITPSAATLQVTVIQ